MPSAEQERTASSPAAGLAGWNPKRRCLLYGRVSTEEQGKGYSLSEQIDLARERAEERGYEVVGVFTDEHTGTEIDRPGLSALYDALAETHAELVVCLDTDRVGRGWPRAFIEAQIERLGARVEYLLADYSGDSGELLKDIRGAIDAFENRQRVERSRRGKNGRAKAGSVTIPEGRTPYGYRYVAREHGGDLVIDEEQAAVVRRIFSLLTVSRLSSYAIARILTEEGVPTKSDLSPMVRSKHARDGWPPTSIRKIVTNQTYTGVWSWGKTRVQKRNGRRLQVSQPETAWIKVAVPAIIDAATWARAQPCLTANKIQARRNAKREYLLQSRIFCVCGRRLVGRFKSHIQRGYYACPANMTERWRTHCPARFSVRQDRVEAAVWHYVMAVLLNPNELRAEIERQRQDALTDTERHAQRLHGLERQLTTINEKLDRLLDKVLDGFPPDRIEARKQALLADRADVEGYLVRARAEAARMSIDPQTVENVWRLASGIQQGEATLTPAERRRMLELLQVRVEVVDATHARVSGWITGSIVDLSRACRVHNMPSFALPFATDLDLVA
jgi:site-specific DNA recombinase